MRIDRWLLDRWRAVARPIFHGLDDFPTERPLLMVGNHTFYGIFDTPLLLDALRARGVRVRPLGDHLHFQVPGWRNLAKSYGVVDGTPAECARLMRRGEVLLVFPGGSREASKRHGEQYRLVWGDRLGFARLAIEHGAALVPFAQVGADDAFDIRLDPDQLMRGPIGPLLRRLPRTDALPPLLSGLWGSPIVPRPERLYFWVGAPIPTVHLGGHVTDAACRAVRDAARSAIEQGIERLLIEQASDPERRLRCAFG